MGHISLRVDRSAINDVVRQLDAVGELCVRAPEALMAGAEVLLPVAEAAAPVRSGRLQKTIAIRKRGYGTSVSVEVGAINSPVAHLVEGGHGGPKPAPAHPFLEPAAQSVEEQVNDAILAKLLEGM